VVTEKNLAVDSLAVPAAVEEVPVVAVEATLVDHGRKDDLDFAKSGVAGAMNERVPVELVGPVFVVGIQSLAGDVAAEESVAAGCHGLEVQLVSEQAAAVDLVDGDAEEFEEGEHSSAAPRLEQLAEAVDAAVAGEEDPGGN
jgi:hypothetical protein